jgi:hypothetical protein
MTLLLIWFTLVTGYLVAWGCAEYFAGHFDSLICRIAAMADAWNCLYDGQR